MQTQLPRGREPRRSIAWPVAISVVALVVLLIAAGLAVWHALTALPRAAVDQTREILQAAQSIAAAFREGTVEHRFVSWATTVSGSNYLQFATVRRMEQFTRADRASIFWGSVDLPEVVVSVSAPVQYTAFVDLDDAWEFRLDERVLWVRAPKIRFNRPAIDTARLEYEVRAGSLLRDEQAAVEQLRRSLTRLAVLRSRDLLPVVRETGRAKIADFVRNWLMHSFTDAGDLHIEVKFADEDSSPVQVQQVTTDR